MNVKAFSILFFTLLAFVLFISLVNAEVVSNGLVYWSNKTKQFFAGSSKIHIDNNTYVVDYNLEQGWIKVHAEIPTLLVFCDPFSGKWVKKFVKKGETNVSLPFKPKAYGGLKMLIISSPWGFGFVKERENVLSWYDYPVVILLSEMAKWSWERALYVFCLGFVGLAYAYFVKKELLIVNRGWQLLFAIFGVIVILIILGLEHHTVEVKILHDNQTIVKTVEAIEFNGYRIKQFYNYLFAVFFVIGYIIGLKFFRNEFFTTIKPLMDRIEINSYPINIDKKIIRDHDGKIAILEIVEPVGEFNVVENGYHIRAFVEIDRREQQASKNIELASRKALLVSFGVVALLFLGDLLNLFKVDLPSMGIIAGLVFALININNVKELLLTPSKTLTIYSTELITNDRYYADLLNGKLKEMAKVYNKLKKELIRKEFEIDYKIATEIFSIAKSLEVTPEPSDGDGK